MSDRTIWEIHGLDALLTETGTTLDDIHRETGIELGHLEQIRRNSGSRYWRHKTIRKVQDFFERREKKVQKRKRSFG